jgi:hypothetical protein
MHGQHFCTNLENILALTQALCNEYGMENIHGVDGSDVKDGNGGGDSCGEADHTSSCDT